MVIRSWVRSVEKIDADLKDRHERLRLARARRDVTMIIAQQDKINDLLDERWKAAGND